MFKKLFNIQTERKFNPFDVTTFDYASESEILKIDGIPIYNVIYYKHLNKMEEEYVTEKEFVKLFMLKNNRNIEDNNRILETKYYIMYPHCFPLLISDLVIDNYRYTLAQYDFVKNLNNDDLVKLTKIIKNHFQNNDKKYKLRQSIFDNHIFIDNYYFTDLCYADFICTEQEIMLDYYLEFETESKDELLAILDESKYLGAYPRLKNKIIQLHI